jgi:hypothetical protein
MVRTASRIRRRVSGAIGTRLFDAFSTLDTVLCDTPTARAISFMLGGLRVGIADA